MTLTILFNLRNLVTVMAFMTVIVFATSVNAGGIRYDTVVDADRAGDNTVDAELMGREGQMPVCRDRIWLISTRHLSSNVCCANLINPSPAVWRLDTCGRLSRSSLDEYRASLMPDRPTVVYVHGNRTSASVAVQRGLTIYRYVTRYRCAQPIDWVIWSWPSEQQGILINDAREKAKRTDAQGMYLALFLRENFDPGHPPALIGYSFGGRVVTGSLHALAGGTLGGRRLPAPHVSGLYARAGLVAPAIERSWLLPSGYHGKATQNLDRLVLMYNHRDSVLKRYWLIDRMRSSVALGYSGPRAFGPRFDGSRLPVIARDFAQVIGNHHNELDYYQKDCRASSEMARLIHATRRYPDPYDAGDTR